MTEPVIKRSRHTLDGNSAQELLDALSSGACDHDEFLLAVSNMLQRAPDMGWEILALVDQYYRRGKITSEAFGSVKTHLQDLLLGKGNAEISVPRKPLAGFSAEPRPPAPSAPNLAVPRVAAAPKPATGAGAPLQGFGATQALASSGSPAASASAGQRPALGRTSALPVKPPRAADSAFVTRPASIPLTGQEASDGSFDEPLVAPHRTPVEGDLLRGRYLVKGVLGQGGMGTVFEAIDQFRVDRSTGDQRVAIKVLHTAVIQRPRLFAELRREFQHLQSLSHANIVRVHEFDRDGDLAFFTMEYLSGVLLGRIVSNREAPLFRPYALAVVRDVGAAIVHAHSRGVVHGDLNPGNIFITDNGEVRVLDFGASHQLRHGPWISEFEAQQHVPVATPSYASCQLLAGETADAGDDIYALACVAYVLLSGNHPFDDQTALRARSLGLTPRRPSGLTWRQWHALKAGLNFERERRPSNAREWLERLDLSGAAPHLPALPLLTKVQRQRSRGGAWIVAAVGVAVLAVAAWWVSMHADFVTRTGDRVAATWESFFGNRTAQPSAPQVAANAAEAVGSDASASASASFPAPASRSSPTSSPAATRPASAASPTLASVSAASPAPSVAATSPSASGVSGTGGLANPVSSASQSAGRATAGAHIAPLGSAAMANAEAAAGGTPASPIAGANGIPFRARIELTADTIEVTPGDSVARITVRRSRAMHGDAGFSWWTESGTAKPGRDFVPVKSHVETMASGKTSASLEIPLVVDPAQRDSRSFYVVIDAANEDAAVGPRTLTMVTIPGPD